MSIDMFQPPLRACSLLSEAKFKYRTKFEIHACEWNPTMDLLALASRKGEVVVKRCGWKTGWKRDFSKDASLRRWRELFLSGSPGPNDDPSDSTALNKESSLAAICWSPDGQCLAVAFDSGRVYYLDAQNGRSVYAKRFENKPARLKWVKLQAGGESVSRNSSLPSADVFPSLDGSSTKEHAGMMADLEAFTRRVIPDSLHNTVLIAVSSDGSGAAVVIDLYASGVLHLARLDVTASLQRLTANSLLIDSTSVELLDFGLTCADGHLRAVVKYCAQSIREGEGVGWSTSVLRWRLGMVDRAHQLRHVMAAAESLAEMSYCSAYVREMFEAVAHDWKAQSEVFHRRVLPNLNPSSTVTHPLQLYQNFFLLLTTGRVPESMRDHLQNDSTLKELKLAASFVDDHFPLLTRAISTHLRPAVECFAHALVSFKSATLNLFELMAEERENGAVRFLRTLQKIHKRDEKLAPIDWELEDRTEAERKLLRMVTQLESALKTLEGLFAEIGRTAVENREELSELISWLSSQCVRCMKELESGGGDDADGADAGEKGEEEGVEDGADPTQQLRLVKFFSKATGLYSDSSEGLHSELAFLDAWRSRTLPEGENTTESPIMVPQRLQLDRVLPLVAESFPAAMRECMGPLVELFHRGIHDALDGELGETAAIVHVEALHPEGLSAVRLLLPSSEDDQFMAALRTDGSELSFYRVDHGSSGVAAGDVGVAECVKTISAGATIKVLDQGIDSSTSVAGLLKMQRDGESAEGTYVFRASVMSDGEPDLEVDLASSLVDSPDQLKIGNRLALVMDANRNKLMWATLANTEEINGHEEETSHVQFTDAHID